MVDAEELLEMAVEENDADTVDIVAHDADEFEKRVADLEFRPIFYGKID